MLSVWSKRLTHFSKYFLLLSIAFFFSPAYVLSLFNPCKSTSSQLCKDSMTSLLLVCVLPYLFLLGVPWLHFACLRWEMVCLPTTASSLEKEMTTHSSVLAWRIPGTGEPGGLPSMGSHRVGHDWSDLAAAAAAALSLKVSPFLNHLFVLGGTQDESGQILWSRFSNRHLWMKSSSERKQKSSRIF